MLLRHNFTEVSSKLELIAAPHSNREAVRRNPCERVHCSIPQEQLLPTSTPGTHPFYSPTSILRPQQNVTPLFPHDPLVLTAPPLSSTTEHRASTCFDSPLRTAAPFCGKPTCRSPPALGCTQPTGRRCPAASHSTQQHGGPALRRHVWRFGRRHGTGGSNPRARPLLATKPPGALLPPHQDRRSHTPRQP